jgi:threonylcarbamoyladenosine tRNA methylthiotransferase CDKAL1
VQSVKCCADNYSSPENRKYIDKGINKYISTMPVTPHIGCKKISDESWLKSLSDRRVYIETYGCRYNFGDTAKLVEVLKNKGSIVVDSPDFADAIVINTCTVVGPTERRMLRRLSLYRDHDLYITGCLPSVQKGSIFAVCSPTIISPDSIQGAYRGVGTVSAGSIGIVQIAQGCAGRCSYCITRKARGALKSFSPNEVISQVKAFSSLGTTEIQITAQDVSAWGQDTGKSFPLLLRSIGDLPGKFMIRVGMMNPATIRGNLESLLEGFQSEKIFKFVHIPVQSGSDRVLESMKRGYTVSEFEHIVAAFKMRFPGISIATDVIVGYPNETDEDFRQTCDLISQIRPVKVNVTRFSHRPFTSIDSGLDLSDFIKKERSRNLNALAGKIYSSVNASLLGTITPFVVTEVIRPGSVMARSPEYLGIVIQEDLPAGYRGKALLIKDRKYFFIGERISIPQKTEI